MEKAKIVIKSLDPRNGQPSDNEVSFLRAQLADKDKLIKQLTKENEKIRTSRDHEEHLIASAWYQLGANLNRRATDERITTIGNSFLAQQRHIPSASLSTVNNSAAVLSTSSCSTSANMIKPTLTSGSSYSKLTNNSSSATNSNNNVNIDWIFFVNLMVFFCSKYFFIYSKIENKFLTCIFWNDSTFSFESYFAK